MRLSTSISVSNANAPAESASVIMRPPCIERKIPS
jgi:hypothetical protein